ncbi:MAG TPA: AAA family ATPase [Phycisphaerae bacterium]|nr:AAA family ATPase [Phycisphaerae bacterium]
MQPVRVLLFDLDAALAQQMKESIGGRSDVQIVEQVAGPSELAAAVERPPPDVVFANLDAAPGETLNVVAGLAKQHPAMRFFAVSARNDAELIVKAMRSGFSDVIRLPDERDRVGEVIDSVRQRPPEAEGGGKLIAVIGSAGGVGCTTLAVNLAVELARKCGRDVALVDLDFQFGHVATMLDLDIQHSVADLCGESKTLDHRVIQKAVQRHKSGVHVLPRPREFEEAGGLTAEDCGRLLEIMQEMYPYVLVDGPGRFDETGRSILDVADWTLLVVQPLVTSARNARRMLQALQRYDFDPARIEVICNRVGGGLTHLNPEQLEKSLGHKILINIPDDWMSVSSAINLGEPLATSTPKSKVRAAVEELADAIMGGVEASREAQGSTGLIGRLLGRGKG